MAYQYFLPVRPYSDDEARTLLADVMSPETSEWHYRKHHAGYVAALNAIETATETVPTDPQNGNFAPYAEAKRRFPFNHAGTVLHDVFWSNLGGDGDTSVINDKLQRTLEQQFGSLENLKQAFAAAAMSTKLSGWAVLCFDFLLGQRWEIVVVDEHQNGAIWGSMPLIAIDMFEHAYYHKDGPGRATYVENFWNNLHWGRIGDRYSEFILPTQAKLCAGQEDCVVCD